MTSAKQRSRASYTTFQTSVVPVNCPGYEFIHSCRPLPGGGVCCEISASLDQRGKDSIPIHRSACTSVGGEDLGEAEVGA